MKLVFLDRQLVHSSTSGNMAASQLRGQTYDGAGAMAGKTKGVAARITELYPKALYTQCS